MKKIIYLFVLLFCFYAISYGQSPGQSPGQSSGQSPEQSQVQSSEQGQSQSLEQSSVEKQEPESGQSEKKIPEQSKKSLFRIERNKNANIVQYDLNIDSSGSIDTSNPLDAYWIMLARDGRREEISAFEKKAYGYKISQNKDGSFNLVLNSVKEKTIRVFIENGIAKAQISINGKKAYLSKVYVFAKEGVLIPTVLYYSLTGTDIATGKEITEKIDVK